MARAQGARAQMALAFETVYGTAPASGYTRVPFASTSLGSEQPLLNFGAARLRKRLRGPNRVGSSGLSTFLSWGPVFDR
jgi:hypothetical protein